MRSEDAAMPLKINVARKSGQRPGTAGVWLQAFRLHYVPTSIFPALLGSVIAWATYREFNVLNFTMVIAGVTLHHIGLNMIDDVFDFLHAADRSYGDTKNPYTGGSGVLTEGLLPTRLVLLASIICYLAGIMIAIYLTVAVGWPVLCFTLVGVFSSVFYTMPPLRYGYRGFGELSLLINFGPVICLGAFYVQTRVIAWEPLIVSLVPGFLMWSMIVINEIPDYEADRAAGKLNIVARFGRKRGVGLYVAGLVCAYAVMLVSVAIGIASIGVLLGLLTVPVAYHSFRILNDHYMDRISVAPANLAMIRVHALTLTFLIIGYFAAGIMS
jgi:1,4-dihydroxy-2-naphthoate octaprenyltransferase